jgi:proton glutamate symport protein
MKTPPKGVRPTLAALVGLGAGFLLGIALHGSTDPWVGRAMSAVAAIGQVWVSALRMAALPLVVTLTLAAVVGARREGTIGLLGLRTVLLFAAMLVAAGLIAYSVTLPALSVWRVDAGAAEAFRSSSASASTATAAGEQAPHVSVGDWLVSLVPTNVFQSAVNGEVLPLLLFTIVFGFAIRRLEGPSQEMLSRLVRGFADAMMVVVGFVLKALPIGVFGLCAAFAFRIGVRVTGVVAVWIVLISLVLILVTLLLYPFTAAAGRVSLGRFARAVAPAQLVAVGTRSSLASLPALVAGGQQHLALPPSATGFVLPLAVATFKLNMTISGPVKLLFLAHVYQIPLGVPQLAAFLLTEVIISFSTAGIPSMGTVRSIPAYLAAGIPVEGVFILNAVDTIPDLFKTILNVTADMSAATVLSGRERRRLAAAPSAEPFEGASTEVASGSSRSSS